MDIWFVLKLDWIFSSWPGLDHTKFGFYHFQSFLFIVVIVISILIKTLYF